jgi:hypothetical protein
MEHYANSAASCQQDAGEFGHAEAGDMMLSPLCESFMSPALFGETGGPRFVRPEKV